MVDGEGEPRGVRVVPAAVQDRDARFTLAPDLAAHLSLLLAGLDRGCAGDDPRPFRQRHGITAEIVGTRGRESFQVEPRRWTIERTFGCLPRSRRLRVDDAMSTETSRHMTVLASLFMTGMRLERMLQS